MPHPALSADAGALTLPQAVARALEHNGELAALREELGIQEAETRRAGVHPDAVVEAGLASGAWTGSDGEDRLSVGISREFLTFGKRGLRRAVADTELAAQRERVREAERLLKREVKERFHALLLARERVVLARRASELERELVRIAGERFAAGDAAEVEVNLARVEVSRAAERAVAAERETAQPLAELARLLGLPSGENPETQGRLAFREIAVEPADLAERALRERPDLRALLLEREGRETAVDLARAEGLPNVTLGFSYIHERTVDELDGGEERSSDRLLGLQLSVPVPASERREALLREASARKGGTERRLEALRRAVARDVEAAAARLGAAGVSLRLYREEILPRLEENLAVVREAYRLGETGILNVLEEQRKFFEVNGAHLQALYDWNLALAALEAAVGAELTELEGEKQ